MMNFFKKKSSFPETWDESFYLQNNPDICEAVRKGELKSGYEHYRRIGRLEDRPVYISPPEEWDEVQFLYSQPKVARAVELGLIKSGWHFYLQARTIRSDRIGIVAHTHRFIEMANIEPALFPTIALLEKYSEDPIWEDESLLDIFAEFGSLIGDTSFTHLVLAPWLKKGGADKVVLAHLHYLASKPANRVMLLTTEANESPWIYHVPASVTIFQFDSHSIASPMSFLSDVFLHRMLMRTGASVLHIINSKAGWHLLKNHGSSLRSQFNIFVSAFAYERHFSNSRVGYLTQSPDIVPYICNFITDNYAVIEETMSIYGIEKAKFFAVEYPIIVDRKYNWSGRSRKILWASRFELEKRVDVLLEIVTHLKDVEFQIYGDLSEDASDLTKYYWSALGRSVNVTMHGAYDGFDSIPVDDYAAFLYTTEGDGLPNVLLEAQASGLACLAPRIGGISEIVSGDYGFLIEDFKDADAYISQIELIFADPKRVHDEVDRAIKNLEETRTERHFRERLDQLPGYDGVPSDMSPPSP